MFTIPTNLYQSSYSGFDPSMRSSLLKKFTKRYEKAADKPFSLTLPKGGTDYLNRVGEGYSKAMASLPQLYSQSLQPATQNVLNTLAGRGMLNSTVASEAMSDMARNLSRDVGQMQTELAGREAGSRADLLGRMMAGEYGRGEQNLGSLVNLISDVGRYSTSSDPLQPYQLMSNIMMRLSGY